LAALAALVLVLAVWKSVRSEAKPMSRAEDAFAVPVARVAREDLVNEVTIPAEFRPYAEVDLHAKVSGYVREIKVDFGDHVKAGQLLATLEVPELEDDLQNAIAARQRAEADYTNAHLIFDRLSAVNQQHPNLVALQDLDTASAKDLTAAAAIAAAKAEVEKYKTMIEYTKITAPFDGVITRRYADPGALIQAGTASDTQSLPLVRVSDNYRLRLDFPVSVAYVKDIRVGDQVEVRVDSLGGRTFSGSITRTMSKVSEETRTMVTEIEVPNPKLELVPGMYAAVELKAERRPRVLSVPVESVASGQRPSVYVVNDRGEIEERSVTLGLETATRYEVLDGLREGERVLIGSRSLVKPGQKVQAKIVGPLAQQ
jgi:RND family efflux transporter MFP subunit